MSHLATCFQLSFPPCLNLLAQLTHTASPTTNPQATEWLDAKAPATTCAQALPHQLLSHQPSNIINPVHIRRRYSRQPAALGERDLLLLSFLTAVGTCPGHSRDPGLDAIVWKRGGLAWAPVVAMRWLTLAQGRLDRAGCSEAPGRRSTFLDPGLFVPPAVVRDEGFLPLLVVSDGVAAVVWGVVVPEYRSFLGF